VARAVLLAAAMPRTLLLSVLVAVTTAACGSHTKDSPTSAAAPAEAHPAAETAQATPITVPDWLVVTGKIVAHDRSDLVADTSGNVTAVLVERGSRVQKGEPLVRIDVRSATLTAAEARANLASMESQRARAEAECARSARLLESGTITRSEWERDQTTCTQAQQGVAAAQARVSLAGKSVADGVVRAPFDGVVSERWVSPGEWASPGTRLRPPRMRTSRPLAGRWRRTGSCSGCGGRRPPGAPGGSPAPPSGGWR